MVSGKTKLLAVLGNPIKHSLSPVIHNAMLKKRLLDFVYIPLILTAISLFFIAIASFIIFSCLSF